MAYRKYSKDYVRAEKMRSTFEATAQEFVWWVYEEPPLMPEQE